MDFEEKTCAICYDHIPTIAATKYRFPFTMICGHEFHYGCVRRWYEGGASKCPLCRLEHQDMPHLHQTPDCEIIRGWEVRWDEEEEEYADQRAAELDVADFIDEFLEGWADFYNPE
jgi:hypothetical protein